MIAKRQAFLTDAATSLIGEIGNHIRIARKRRRWTQEGLAERSGVGVATIIRLEKGSASVGLNVLANVLVALNLEESLLRVANPLEDSVGVAMELRNQPKRIHEGGDDELDTNF